ncbi:MAG TPA: hypothetical protein DCK99_05205 [Blastocatellia bacterium]|nr:hypothetical protein [Blastocatellia bacterium]
MMINRLAPRPQRLGELIDLVNCLPLPNTGEFHLLNPVRIEADLAGDFDASRAVKLVARRLRRLDLPRALGDLLRPRKTDVWAKDIEAWRRWQGLYAARASLYAIPEVVREHQAGSKVRGWAVNLPSLGLDSGFRFFYVDADGFLGEDKDLFSRIVATEDIKADRIKVCPECNRVFWAGRIKMVACPPPRTCANNRRVKRSRIERALREAHRELEAKKRSRITKRAKTVPKR